MGAYIPPGWPAGVHPPGSDDFESTAVGWLLDVVPPDYRLHGVLRRYPVALATMARYHSKACVEGARQGYRTARTELAGVLPPHAIDTVLAAYRKEGARLAATAQRRRPGRARAARRGLHAEDEPAADGTENQKQSAEPERDRAGGGGAQAGGRRRNGGAGHDRQAKRSRGRPERRRRAEGRRRRCGARGGGGGEEGRRSGARAGGGTAEFGRPREERPGPNVRR